MDDKYKASILVVDDDLEVCRSLKIRFSKEEFYTECVSNSQEAIQLTKKDPNRFDIIFMDQALGANSTLDGIETMKNIRSINPSLNVVIITAFGNPEIAVNAIKGGAYRYIYKPYQAEELIAIVKSIVAIKKLKNENQSLKTEVNDWKTSAIKLFLCTILSLVSLIALGILFPKEKFLVLAFIVILALMLIGWRGISKIAMDTILKMKVEGKS